MDRGYPYGSTQSGTREPHHGVEFNNATGTPVLAAADGTVVVAGDDSQNIYAAYPDTYGNLVVIGHHFAEREAPIFTLYGHLSTVDVQAGQTVHKGDVIGQVGSTGEAIGSHLHFEVRQGRDDYASTVNPVLWFEPLIDSTGQSEGIIAGRLEDDQGQPIHTDGINIQYFPDPNGPQAMAWQVETYAPDPQPLNGSDFYHENFALADMPSGNYRISLMWGGRLIERWFFVNPGCITSFTIRLDP